ncbi:MAG: ATP synthase F1 subunit gamma [Bacteroidetes bacterium]|nr:MAG: ATP synthase F1 subunit gamma [Bacteroidota bacterium]RLD96139.1 MAG: ATP synthase F1 subunit gamma [Bacteroidota bacterium]RLE05415.1 MAG: ATP synthase F1 subunit gamma [Bacteroidota bacterium]
MASLKEIRERKVSVASTMQITNAMKMVSAAKLKKAQDAIVQFRPYAEKLQEILASVGDSIKDDEDNQYVVQRDKERILLVLITSNRGLCGAFNSNAIKATITRALTTFDNQMMARQIDFIAIGKKGADFLRKKGYNVIFDGSEIFDDLTFDRVAQVANMIMGLFTDGEYDHVDVIYNRFKNAGTQILTEEQFLPIKADELAEESGPVSNVDYIFEPTKEYIVQELIPRSLRLQFYKAILDSHASEHGARMTAMHKATDNATELLKELSLQFNKARQAAITNEILEIVGGAEALKG